MAEDKFPNLSLMQNIISLWYFKSAHLLKTQNILHVVSGKVHSEIAVLLKLIFLKSNNKNKEIHKNHETKFNNFKCINFSYSLWGEFVIKINLQVIVLNITLFATLFVIFEFNFSFLIGFWYPCSQFIICNLPLFKMLFPYHVPKRNWIMTINNTFWRPSQT